MYNHVTATANECRACICNLVLKISFLATNMQRGKKAYTARIGSAVVINLNTSPDSTIKSSRFRVQYHVILTAASLWLWTAAVYACVHQCTPVYTQVPGVLTMLKSMQVVEIWYKHLKWWSCHGLRTQNPLETYRDPCALRTGLHIRFHGPLNTVVPSVSSYNLYLFTSDWQNRLQSFIEKWLWLTWEHLVVNSVGLEAGDDFVHVSRTKHKNSSLTAEEWEQHINHGNVRWYQSYHLRPGDIRLPGKGI